MYLSKQLLIRSEESPHNDVAPIKLKLKATVS